MSRALPLLPLVALIATACATVPASREPSDVDELKARVLELQRKVTVAEVEIERLRRQVAALEARSAEPARPAAASPAQPSRLARPEPPPALVSDGIEEVDVPPRSLEMAPTPGATAGDGDAARAGGRPEAAGSATPATASPPTASEPRAGEPATAPAPLTAAGQALYDRGYTLYHQGSYVDAEGSFQRFLQSHGSSDLADNALYWIGEARLARADVRGALAAFREVTTRYPNGNKVADSLLKSGDCLARLGDVESARESYGEVVRRFPNTAAAAMAADRRAQLR